MAATSPPTRPTAAAGFSLTPSSGPSRVSLIFCRRRRASPRWRPPRCSRGGKPAVKDVVRDETPPEPNPETMNDSYGTELQQVAGIFGWFRFDSVAADILSIAAPTVLALAADPITALVDTAFVGHIGSAELAAVGASVAVFNLVSKLFNVPLLTVTTSFVAEQQAVDADCNRDEEKSSGQRKILPAVSTSLTLAAGIGLLEMVALIVGSGPLVDIIGFTDANSSRTVSYSEGIWCSANHSGTCSSGCISWILGYKDTIVRCRYLTAFILLWKLNNEVELFSWNIIGGGIIHYLKSGGLLICRTVAVFLTLTLSTSLATREGPVPMAGYEICLQVWLTISLLNDALAVAGQTLLASEYAKGNYKQARKVLYKVLQVGGVTGVALAASLFAGFGPLSLLFTDDPAVLDVARSGVWFVTISQPANAIAFVADGLYYGVSDFAYAAYSTLFAGAIASVFLLATAPKFGLGGIWAGLTLFMSLRAIAGFWRIWSRGGPWEIIWSDRVNKYKPCIFNILDSSEIVCKVNYRTVCMKKSVSTVLQVISLSNIHCPF